MLLRRWKTSSNWKTGWLSLNLSMLERAQYWATLQSHYFYMWNSLTAKNIHLMRFSSEFCETVLGSSHSNLSCTIHSMYVQIQEYSRADIVQTICNTWLLTNKCCLSQFQNVKRHHKNIDCNAPGIITSDAKAKQANDSNMQTICTDGNTISAGYGECDLYGHEGTPTKLEKNPAEMEIIVDSSNVINWSSYVYFVLSVVYLGDIMHMNSWMLFLQFAYLTYRSIPKMPSPPSSITSLSTLANAPIIM